MPGEVSGEEKNSDRNGNGGGRESDFDVALAGDNDEKLNGETDEEEEIELQEGDIHLNSQVRELLWVVDKRREDGRDTLT